MYYVEIYCLQVIAVSATDAGDARAYYSSFGPRIDLAAPGGDRYADLNGDSLPDDRFRRLPAAHRVQVVATAKSAPLFDQPRAPDVDPPAEGAVLRLL